MLQIGSTVFTWLLLLSTFARHAFALDELEREPFLVSPPGLWPDGKTASSSKDAGELEFTLRHIYHHGSHKYPDLHRYQDISSERQASISSEDGASKMQLPRTLKAKAAPKSIERMVDRSRVAIDGLLDRGLAGQPASLPSSAWSIDKISGPDISNKSTIVSLAWMAANAYVEEPFGDDGKWHDVGGGFNVTDDFGWENDGLRGHIFATNDNSTVVVGLKGTSPAIFDGPETTGNDKVNDNLFGSCCCAQQGDYMWKQVCDCRTDTFTCNQTCLVKSLREKSHYYQASQDLYHNVTERYPNAEIWLSGHSLGGVLGTLVGLTYGHPVVTFEAYPDAMAANRLGLPTPPGYRIGSHQSRLDTVIHHLGHSADPIFMGQCHGTFSACSVAGYAFEGACHTGKKCVYDTVNDKSWRMGVGYHSIERVITDVLEAYDTVANCTEELDCVDCYNWKFFEDDGSVTTTSVSAPSSTYTRTRTETCKTPGWWGCLDEPTSTTTTTSSTSTSTCQTPGWFGCKDKTTTSEISSKTPPATPAPSITTVTTTIHTTQSSETCKTPGWFSCKDSTTAASTTPAPITSASQSYAPSASATCTSKRWFGLICDDAESAASSSRPSPTNLPTAKRKTCVKRHWYGACSEWSDRSEDIKSDL